MAIDVSFRDTFSTSAQDLSRIAKNLINVEGVTTGGLIVSQASTPAMSVQVTAGTAYFYGTGANADTMYEFNSDSTEVVNIPTADAQPRIDILCCKVDASTQVASLAVVSGTPAGSPVIPATPASHYKLAEISVSALATTIVNANITNTSEPINLRTDNIVSGWTRVAESWSFSSASGIVGTVTVPSGATNRYQKGDRIRLTQSSTVKYFVVIGVSSTTLTITGGSDYTLTNVGISRISVSRQLSPLAYPTNFQWTPTLTLPTGMTGSLVRAWSYFYVIADECFINLGYTEGAGGTGTSNSISVTAPFTWSSSQLGTVTGYGTIRVSSGNRETAQVLNSTNSNILIRRASDSNNITDGTNLAFFVTAKARI